MIVHCVNASLYALRFRGLGGVLLFILLTTQSGCLEITEEVHFRADMSGRMEVTIDAGPIRSMLESFRKMGRNGDQPSPSALDMRLGKLEQGMKAAEKQMNQAEGIRRFRLSFDRKQWMMGFRLKFRDLAALERIQSILKVPGLLMGKSPNPLQMSYDSQKRIFTRRITLPRWKPDGDGADEHENTGTNPLKWMGQFGVGMKYHLIYRFRSPIAQASLPGTRSRNDREIRFDLDMAQRSRAAGSLEVQIQLK